MKDILHIRRDFHSAVWFIPRGGTGCVPWGVKGHFFMKSNQIWCVSSHTNGTCTGTIFLVPAPGAFGRGQKNILDMVMWNIKLKGMSRIHLTILTYDQTGDLGMGQRVNYH